MKTHTYTFLAIQYHHPETVGLDARPRYVIYEGFGNMVRSDLAWQPTSATKFDLTPQGYQWAAQTLNAFCERTELKSEHCKIVEVLVDVKPAACERPVLQRGQVYRSRKPHRMDGSHAELTIHSINETHAICRNQYGSESSHAVSTFHDRWVLKGE